MSPKQWKFRLTVVKSVHIGPRPSIVTGLAPKRRAVRPPPRHAVLELAVMWVLMARRAATVFETEGQNFIRAVRHLRLVAIVAGDGHVCPREGIFRIAMLGDGEERAVKILDGVAVFTAIVVRRVRKLPVVHVLMTVHAVRELHFVNRALTGWKMALVASHLCVPTFKWIARSGVLLYTEQ